MGVKTGAANWQARQCCPGLICVPPHYELYLKYSRLVRRIYARYTDDIEPFGMDENWLAIPYGRGDVEREGRMIAEEIRKSVRNPRDAGTGSALVPGTGRSQPAVAQLTTPPFEAVPLCAFAAQKIVKRGFLSLPFRGVYGNTHSAQGQYTSTGGKQP